MDQHRPAVGHGRAPVPDVGAGWSEAVRAVDVEQVDRRRDLLAGGLGGQPHVAHPVLHPGAREVGEERGMVALAVVLPALQLLGSAVVPGVRVDGDDLDAGRGSARQDDR